MPRCTEHGAIATHDNREVRVFANTGKVRGRIFGYARMTGCFGFEENLPTRFGQ